ncbi:MAG: thioredoxin domain-containing protein [Gemmatimonadetes bacterium]|nr:thioredoxin domain-containing protein [Gemmatimonadota bacterium]
MNTGKVRVAFLNFPIASIHKNAVAAADAAMCAASQRKFWAFHDAVFASQEQWAQSNDPTAAFEAAAQKAGVDLVQQRACVAQKRSRPLVEADASRGMRAGVGSTPSFFVGDTAVAGALPAAEFTKLIDQQLAKKAGSGSR